MICGTRTCGVRISRTRKRLDAEFYAGLSVCVHVLMMVMMMQSSEGYIAADLFWLRVLRAYKSRECIRNERSKEILGVFVSRLALFS